jgi:transcriptional regulator with XRE-family HTH domain
MGIGNRIIMLAKQRGITQAEIADKLSISPSAVSAWAKKGHNPPIKSLPQIADILGVSIEYILTGKGGPADLDLDSPDENAPGGEPPPPTDISRCLAIIASQQNTIDYQTRVLGEIASK